MFDRRSNELWIAFLLIGCITVVYLAVVVSLGSIPAASDFFGHSLGAAGLVLMLMTETLYTIRKRRGTVRWGRTADWLRFHIITGLVGPYMALLHSSWKFNGLAGIVLLLTLIIVLSGFIGRYIYTAVPRTSDGVEVEQIVLEEQINKIQDELERSLVDQDEQTRQAVYRLAGLGSMREGGASLVLTRIFTNWKLDLEWLSLQSKLRKLGLNQVHDLKALVDRRRALTRQINSILAVRKLLAIWHTVHIPIGLTLFLAAFIHLFAAIYFATLLR